MILMDLFLCLKMIMMMMLMMKEINQKYYREKIVNQIINNIHKAYSYDYKKIQKWTSFLHWLSNPSLGLI